MRYLIILLFLGSFSSFAQNIYSNGVGTGVMYLKPMGAATPANSKRGSYIGPHIFGDSITFLLNKFEKEYVYYKTSSGAYPVEEKVVLRRYVYKRIHEFDDFITKSYKMNQVELLEAVARLTKVLNVGIKLSGFDTRELEKELKKINSPTEVEKYLMDLQFR